MDERWAFSASLAAMRLDGLYLIVALVVVGGGGFVSLGE
jgi:hypothetical protein